MGQPWPSDAAARHRWYSRPLAERPAGPVVLVCEELMPDSPRIPPAARAFAAELAGRAVRVLYTVAATPGGGAPAVTVSVQSPGFMAFWSQRYSPARQTWSWVSDYAIVSGTRRPVKMSITELRQLLNNAKIGA